jgi:hypothetical protein
MSARRPPRRARHQLPVPKHPFRDSAVVNGVLAALLLVVAWLTGGNVVRAVIYAVAFFLIATAWNWWRFRQRLAREAAAEDVSRRGRP